MFVLHPRIHSILDYVVVALLFLLPLLLGLPEKPAGFFYAMALALLIVSLCTDYPFSRLKGMPFTTHGVLELIIGVWLLTGPWLYRYTGTLGGDISILLGIALTLMWVLTDHHETETREYHQQMHVHHR
jgi:hypothetical protein